MAETRITAGEWRGRKIETPAGHSTRPTSSKVREALFNILGDRVEGASILDLYAGAGTFSFEALSRGADSAVLVERDPRVTKLIEKSAAALGCAGRVTVVTDSVEHWLQRHPEERFDLIWLDPPYADTGIDAALERAARLAGALLVCEHRKSRPLADRIGPIGRTRRADYGQTSLSFYQRTDQEAPASDE
jgi:16S rRNA (guanine966-N2)-methyltransferase